MQSPTKVAVVGCVGSGRRSVLGRLVRGSGGLDRRTIEKFEKYEVELSGIDPTTAEGKAAVEWRLAGTMIDTLALQRFDILVRIDTLFSVAGDGEPIEIAPINWPTRGITLLLQRLAEEEQGSLPAVILVVSAPDLAAIGGGSGGLAATRQPSWNTRVHRGWRRCLPARPVTWWW